MDVDSNRKLKVVLSERLAGQVSKDRQVAVSVYTDNKIPDTVREATLLPSIYHDDEADLRLDGTAADKTSQTTVLRGRQSSSAAAEKLVLFFDPTTQTYTLDQIDAELRFDRTESTSPDRLSETSQAAPVLDAWTADDETAGPNPSNPFDWRNELRRQRVEGPELGVETADSSPEARPTVRGRGQRRERQASTPPDERESPASSRRRSPSSTGERSNLEASADEVEAADAADDGGLEIVMDGATDPAQRFRGRFLHRPTSGAPISLRSAANSRSPAVHGASRLHQGNGGHEASEASDEDVEEMQLGTPRRPREQVDASPGPTSPREVHDQGEKENQDEDEDADLLAEFEKVLEEQDDGEGEGEETVNDVVVGAARVESSSESEEE